MARTGEGGAVVSSAFRWRDISVKSPSKLESVVLSRLSANGANSTEIVSLTTDIPASSSGMVRLNSAAYIATLSSAFAKEDCSRLLRNATVPEESDMAPTSTVSSMRHNMLRVDDTIGLRSSDVVVDVVWRVSFGRPLSTVSRLFPRVVGVAVACGEDETSV